MIWMLVSILLMLGLIFIALLQINDNFRRWANADIKTRKLSERK